MYLASASDVSTVCIMLVVLRIDPFGVYFLTCVEPRYKCPPQQRLDFGSDKYDVSECILRIM